MSYLPHRFTVAALGLVLAAAGPLSAQSADLVGVPVERAAEEEKSVEKPAVAAVPFGIGEHATYQVRVGLFGGVGNGSMEVTGVEDVRGHPSYNLRLTIKGGVPFYKVDTRFESWLDVDQLLSRRFEQDQKEGKFKRHRIFEFYPEERRWERAQTDEAGELPTDIPLDDVSFLYYVRTLPLEVGQTYTFPRYFRDKGNPVVLKVLRREKVKVPAGTFETVVVQPIIKTSGLFGEGGKAEVYFTDDDRRILVQMKSKMPVLRSLNLVLQSYVPGTKLTPETLESAMTNGRGGGNGGEGGSETVPAADTRG